MNGRKTSVSRKNLPSMGTGKNQQTDRRKATTLVPVFKLKISCSFLRATHQTQQFFGEKWNFRSYTHTAETEG